MKTDYATPASGQFFRTTRSACAVALLVSLAACGGGGGGGGSGFVGFPTSGGGTTVPPASDPPAATAVTFSGTAASGLPLSGTVTVKDAKGATKTEPLVDGNYKIDVTGMTAPFVFRAEGTVGGVRTVIHSAATAADANGTINITPLTDLVVANIAGRLAAQYFEGGEFASLAPDELKAESDALKAKLLPVLQALGVDSSIDLLRTAFTPLSSALDKALDVLRVSVDPATNVATITNIVTQQQITDDLAVKAAQDAGTTPMSGAGMETAADDITLIRKALTDYVAKFATGLPTAGELTPLLATSSNSPYNFRLSDLSAAEFANEEAADTSMVGASFTEVVINRINYTIDPVNNPGPRAYVEFTHRDRNGVAFSNNKGMQVVKGNDGVWRFRGDGRVLDINPHVQVSKDAVTGCVTTALQFSIRDSNPSNSNAAVSVVVTGPGLPPNGLRHVRPALAGDYWPIENGDGSNLYRLASNCANLPTAGLTDSAIAAIPATPEYGFTAYTSGGQVAQITNSTTDIVYRQSFNARPMTLAEAAAAAYPSFTTTPAFASYNGGSDFTVSATGLNPGFAAEFFLNLFASSSDNAQEQADVAPSTGGTASKTFNLSVGSTPVFRNMYVSTRDATWRDVVLRDSRILPP
jgi:hypothetical protein